MLKGLVKGALNRAGIEIRRPPPLPYLPQCVTLPPAGQPRGRCLMAYILQPFLDDAARTRTSHTHFLESVLMAQVWTELGFEVDVIDYRNAAFQPQGRYDHFVSARKHLAEVGARLNEDCTRIAHLDTAHFATNNAAAYGRHIAFQAGHGVAVPESLRIIEHNLGIDAADCGVLLGNGTTQASYEYAGKPLYQISVPAAVDYELTSSRDIESSRTRFLWLGSSGLLHKGVDLVIEAFAGLPDLEVTICGPVEQEPRLLRCYQGTLERCDNIHVHGWVDVGSAEFQHLLDRCVGVVYPSCGEGQAGSVVTCVRAGLIPIVSAQTGLDVGDWGVTIDGLDADSVGRAVSQVAAMPGEELQRRVGRAHRAGIDDHSAQAYLARYRDVISDILESRPATARLGG